MKLLASLLGAAAADYACCPYDNFGVVFEGCPLTEKTPWAMDSNNADPKGVEHHMCKAWEANVDATFEGTEDYDNWGGCGFQRHFPWFWGPKETLMVGDSSQGGALMHCKLGYMDCSTSTMSTKYNTLQVATNKFSLSLDGSPFTGGTQAAGHAAVVGQVHLGAVCKLWIPVRLKFIDSVQVSGVHMRGGGTLAGDKQTKTNDNPDGLSSAVFNEALVCEDTDCAGTAKRATGTAYCFSVVNIGEFMENHHEGQTTKGGAKFNVMNGNVAGKDAFGHDPIRLPGPVSRQEYDVHFGEPLDHQAVVAGALHGDGTIVESGANFDVVVHFKSQWCMRHWHIVDLQQTDDGAGSNNGHHDWGSAKFDYEVVSDPVNQPHHHHTDVADKRFGADVGICGCCNQAGLRHDDDHYWDGTNHVPKIPHPDSDTLLTNEAAKCVPCSQTTNPLYQGCDIINTYEDSFVTGQTNADTYKWPNAGAWAAFYSFITCSNHEFMIYDVAESIDTATGIVGVVDRNLKKQKRTVVHSMFYNDIRHDYSNNAGTGTVCIRGNIRQVGSKIVYCGPGIINTESHGQSPPNNPGSEHNGPTVGTPTPSAPTNTQWMGGNFINHKRCTWNWNFHEGVLTTQGQAGAVQDPETWFETENPNYQRVWDQGKAIPRGHDTGTLGTNGHRDYVTPITETVTFSIAFQTDLDEEPTLGSSPPIVRELYIDAPKYFTTPTEMKAGFRTLDKGATGEDTAHYWSFTMFCLQTSLDGTGDKMPATVQNTDNVVGLDGWGFGHSPDTGNPDAPNKQQDILALGDNDVHQYRDLFPDCYMGDEIHFEYVITGGQNVHTASPGNNDHRISAWYSHVEAHFQSSYA